MRFDLTDLRLFLNVVEARSITHGAERSALALASASARIRGMEEAGGVALLERTPRGIRPTPAGQALTHHARLVLGQLEQMRGDLRLYAQGLRGRVRLLAVTAALSHLSGPLGRFLAEHPTIDVDLEEKTSQDIVPMVAGGLAEIGIAADTTVLAGLETHPFRRDRLVLAVPAGHPLAGRDALALREVLDEPFVGLGHGSSLQVYLAGHAAREGRPFKLRVRLKSLEAVCGMVACGVGVAIVPEATLAALPNDAAIRPVALAEPWAARNLMLCLRAFADLPAHAQLLVSHLSRIA